MFKKINRSLESVFSYIKGLSADTKTFLLLHVTMPVQLSQEEGDSTGAPPNSTHDWLRVA